MNIGGTLMKDTKKSCSYYQREYPTITGDDAKRFLARKEANDKHIQEVVQRIREEQQNVSRKD